MEAKHWKYQYNKLDCGYVTVSPVEARLGFSDKSYVSVHENGVTLAGGQPSQILMHSMSPIYGAMVQNTLFPMSMIPGPMSPPNQIPNIPMEEVLPTVQSVATAVSAMASSAAGTAVT
jgi:hypothetical protein